MEWKGKGPVAFFFPLSVFFHLLFLTSNQSIEWAELITGRVGKGRKGKCKGGYHEWIWEWEGGSVGVGGA